MTKIKQIFWQLYCIQPLALRSVSLTTLWKWGCMTLVISIDDVTVYEN
jgi:hypothetical protein